jgi:hypothetical protein
VDVEEDQAERIDALAGFLLAHTSMIVATLGVLREQGLITGDTINAIFEAAAIGTETMSASVTPAERDAARKLIENMSAGMLGPPRPDDLD